MKGKEKDILRKLKTTDRGFSVPDGYFDSLDSKLGMLVSNTSKDDPEPTDITDLKSDGSLLNLKKEEPGFKTPQDYFESFEPKALTNVSGKVVSLKNKTARIISMAIAASVLLFFGIQYNYMTPPSSTELSLQEEDISNWIEMDLVELNSYDIAEAYDDIELDEISYTDEELYHYLNDVDLESIILEN